MRALFLGLMLPTLVSVAHANAGDHRIWIETSIDNGVLLAQPRIEAGHDALLDYQGSVRVTQGETRSLARLRLSVAGRDKYILSLRVYEDGRLIAEDSVSYP